MRHPRRPLLTLLWLLVTASGAAAYPTDDFIRAEMQRRQIPSCAAIAPGASISTVGTFSSVRYTVEHAYGYTIRLWRSGDCLVGLFESAQGLAGDTPIGELRDVTYDRSTGRLSFTSRLTSGVTNVPRSRVYEPTRDVFAFDGRVSAGAVTGVITHSQENYPNIAPTRNDVVLQSLPGGADGMSAPTTYGAWRKQWEPILRARGPKP